MTYRSILPLLFLFAVAACTNNGDTGSGTGETTSPPVIPAINYRVVNTYPHDTTAYTEGLLMHDGRLYESTGATKDLPQTRSLFGDVNLQTGRINTRVELNRKEFFGEGISFLDGKIYQLTYTEGKGFIYDARTFRKLGEFDLPVDEGWGMTTNGSSLIMTDGTDLISYMDPRTFLVTRQLKVTAADGPVDQLNEVELIDGSLYANVYGTSTIVKIDTISGRVTGRMEMGSLAGEVAGRYRGSKEMNGVAYDAASRRMLITGKMWPVIYEIEFPH